jgi:TP901-1 family phage major tail protein
MRGVDILIMVEDAVTAGTYVEVGGQRNATFSEEVETIDVTSKSSDGYTESDYGLGSWSISCDGVYVLGDAQYKALKDAMRNKEKVKVRWAETGTGGQTEEGFALVTSRELEAPFDAEVTYTVELTGSGKPTATTA